MRKPKEIPEVRREPDAEKESGDPDRIEWVRSLWKSQDWALQQRDRQVEENVRMLAGQQWTVYSDLLGKWIPVDEVLGDKERRWRQRPVVNRLLYWYMLTHARMTENPPVVSFAPSTADRVDALLSEAMDTIYKTLWDELDMVDVIDRWISWVIPGGASYLKTRVDLSRGDVREWYGPTTLDGPNGEEVFVPVAPFDRKGRPQVELQQNGKGLEYHFTGEAFVEREGELCVDVLNPLEVRGEWGNDTPWHRKRWHIHRSYLTPEQVFDIYGVECEPTISSTASDGLGELQRLLFGAGYFGAAGNEPAAGAGMQKNKSGLVEINELWHVPTDAVDGMRKLSNEDPGGRLLVCTPKKVLWDDKRPVDLKYTSPIHKLTFVNLPGRPDGTSPQEMLNPIQRTYNRGVAQLMEHRNLTTNPIMVVDGQSGIQEDQLSNKPGLVLKNVQRRPSVPAIEFVTPPQISDDVYRIQGMLQDEMTYLGNLAGGSGQPQTEDPSGELIKELRFNSDRFVGPTMKRAVRVLSRVVEDWLEYLPTIWTEEKVIAYSGEDQVTRTVTILPEMFEDGSVNVQVDMESMLPEGRGERQKKIWVMYESGLFGEPGTPEARRKFFEMIRMPHLGRAGTPGGIDQVTAQQENGKLVQGIPSDQIPVLKFYDHETHIQVHREFMASPEFLKLDRQMQFAFVEHLQAHLQAAQGLQIEATQRELAAMEALAEAQGGAVGGAPESQRSTNGAGGGDGEGQEQNSENGRRQPVTQAEFPG